MYLTCNSNLGVESITLQQLHAGAFLFKLFNFFQTFMNSGNLGSLGLKLRWNFEALSNRSRSSKTQSKRNSFNAASGTAGISGHGSQIRWISV